MNKNKRFGIEILEHVTEYKVLKGILDGIGWEVDAYLDEYPADKEIQNSWDKVSERMVYIPHTKKGLQN